MTKGLKSILGFGSGKTEEQKRGEVVMKIFNYLNERYHNGNKLSGLEKLIILCARKINDDLTKGILKISENQINTIQATANQGGDKIVFTAQESDGATILYGANKFILDTSNKKNEICENSKFKEAYFDKFLKDLRGSIEVDEKSVADQKAKEDKKTIEQSFARTRAVKKSDQTLKDASNTVENAKALERLHEYKKQSQFNQRAKALGIKESFDLKSEVNAITSNKKISDAEKEKLVLETFQEDAARNFSKKIPKAPEGPITIKKDSATNLGGKGGNDRGKK